MVASEPGQVVTEAALRGNHQVRWASRRQPWSSAILASPFRHVASRAGWSARINHLWEAFRGVWLAAARFIGRQPSEARRYGSLFRLG